MVLIGVVGKPSSGKTTFLNALCKTDAKTGNYPFTTIDPNLGYGYYATPCVCQEFQVSCNPNNSLCEEQIRKIPVKIIDVAGLVPGAHEGRGRGNQFLADLSEADILLHVVDCSGSLNSEGVDVEPGSYDPLNDIQFLEDEIDYWILGILNRNWDKLIRQARAQKTHPTDVLSKQLSGVKITRNDISQVLTQLNLPPDLNKWTKEDRMTFTTAIRKKTKPIIVVANKIDKKTSENNLNRLRDVVGEKKVVSASALSELVLQRHEKANKLTYDSYKGELQIHEDQVSAKEKAILTKIKEEIIEKYGNTGIQESLIRAVDYLNLVVVYPVADVSSLKDKDGNILPDAYLVPKGLTAKKFAGHIHKDLEKGFHHAVDARTKRKLSDKYEVKNNDVLMIKSTL